MSSGGDRGLTEVGLATGERVRFRGPTGGWADGRVEGRERDGSVRLRDVRGAARAIPVERLEVRATGPRGGARWEPLPERLARSEQLRLL